MVEATVAQPIEAQVVGVDKMIYMKSVSGDDGSYTLIVSFELGTNPDINAVNVNNRVQVALSQPAAGGPAPGRDGKEEISALLGVIAVYSPKHTHDPLFLSNYVTINLLDQIKSTPGVGDARLWGPQDYAMRAWVRTDRLTGLGLTTADIINAIQSQNVQAAVGRIGARPISERPAVPAQHSDQGPAQHRSRNSRRSSSGPIRTVRYCASVMSRGWNLARPISTARRASTAARRPPSPSTRRRVPMRSKR